MASASTAAPSAVRSTSTALGSAPSPAPPVAASSHTLGGHEHARAVQPARRELARVAERVAAVHAHRRRRVRRAVTEPGSGDHAAARDEREQRRFARAVAANEERAAADVQRERNVAQRRPLLLRRDRAIARHPCVRVAHMLQSKLQRSAFENWRNRTRTRTRTEPSSQLEPEPNRGFDLELKSNPNSNPNRTSTSTSATTV